MFRAIKLTFMIGSQVNVGCAPNNFRFFFFSGRPFASPSSSLFFIRSVSFVFPFPVSFKGVFGLTLSESGFLAGFAGTASESDSAV